MPCVNHILKTAFFLREKCQLSESTYSMSIFNSKMVKVI